MLIGAGHLAALWALALVQPLFDLLGRNPDFFVARGDTSGDILAFSLLFTLVPPLAILALEALAQWISPRLRWGLHLVLVALLVAVIALQALKGLASGPAGVLIAAAAGLGAAGALAYARTRFAQSLMTVLLPAPLVVLALFLVFSDVSKLVFPQEEASAASVEVRRPAPVVMVVFDEFPGGSLMSPDGRIDASRFPNFAALARRSTWYRGATTIAGFSSRAVPSVLSGRLPDAGELPTSSDQPRSIFTLLGKRYRLRVMENATALCPADLCPQPEGQGAGPGDRLDSLFSDLRVVSGRLLLPDSMADDLPDISQTFGGFAASDDAPPGVTGAGNGEQLAVGLAAGVTEDESVRVARFVSGIRPLRTPTLDLIHIEKPHYPWNHFPDGQRYSRLQSEWASFLGGHSEWKGPRFITDIALQRHMLEAGYSDHLLGEILRRIRRTGLFNRSAIIVAADHGGAVMPGRPRRNPRPANLGQVASVPLFIKAPGQRAGRVVERRTCTTDVLPDLARLLGIRYPWPTQPCPPETVTVADEPSGEATLSFSALERERDQYVARIAALFPGEGWSSVIDFGPGRRLLGRPVSSFDVVGGTQAATLDPPPDLNRIDPAAPEVPFSLIRGSVDGAREGEAVAVAVNGAIAGSGLLFDQEGESRFSILVAPSRFRKGANRVAIYRLLGRGPSTRLQSLGP